MTDGTQADANAEAQKPASLNVLSQYVRSVSFTNDAAKRAKNPSGKPQINVQVNVENQTIAPERHLVALTTSIRAESEGEAVFSAELDYVGVFQLANVPENAIAPVLAIECPRLLFPFSRRIIAELTRDGGFPPLMLDPIDFAALYRQQLTQRAALQANEAAGVA